MSLHYLVKQNMCQSVHNHSNASIKRHDKLTNTSQQMLNVFAFGYDMRIKTSSPVINCLINDAVLDSELKSFLQALSLNVFVYDASHWPLQNASFPGDLMGSFVCPWCTLLTECQIIDCINVLSSTWCARSATAQLSICCAGFSFF